MSVDEALSELESLDRSTLAERWLATFGVPAPKSCQATLLRCALAWQIQSDAAGPASLRPARQLARSGLVFDVQGRRFQSRHATKGSKRYPY